jgi:hypothetical protein
MRVSLVAPALLIALAGLGLGVRAVHADEPLLTPSSSGSAPVIAAAPSLQGAMLPVKEPGEHSSRVGSWLRSHNLCCFTHHNTPGCGSFWSDFMFEFGSCRSFFGEPCFAKPPSNRGADGGAAGGAAGCSCR